MPEKKSLVMAMEEARRMSLQRPGVEFHVMDMTRKRATVTCNAWVYKERLLSGWHRYCSFRDGKMI